MALSLGLLRPGSAVFPAANAPKEKWRAGTNYTSLTLAFPGADGSADSSCTFEAVLPDAYGGGDLEIRIYWEPDTGAPNGENCSWDISVIGRVDDEAFDAAFSDTGTVNDVVTAAGDLQVASLTLSSPTLAAGDWIVLKINRDYDEANGGTALGEDALLHGIQILEA